MLPTHGAPAIAPEGSLVGRRPQLRAVDQVVGAAAVGRGGLLLLVGEAGVGKTTLAREAAERARGAGLAVAWAACWQTEAAPAFWPWIQLGDQLGLPALAELGSPAAGGTGPDPEAVRLRRFETVVAGLRAAAAARPVVCVLDDLHWADPSSILLLDHVATVLPTLPVALVAAYRDGAADPGTPAGEALASLDRRGYHVPLEGLQPDELAELVRSLTGERPEPAAAAALRRHTGGNPLFATELIRLLDARGELGALNPAGPVLPPVPATVHATLEGRLARLSPGCRELLTLGAVVGDEFGVPALAATGGLPPDEVLAGVGEAVAAKLLAEAGPGRFVFAHSLVRAVLYDDLALSARVRLHLRVGQALEALAAAGHQVDPSALAHHFVAAAPAGDPARAVRYASEAAARSLAALAYEDAIRLYGQALGALELDPGAGDRLELILSSGEALAASGQPDEARSRFLAAAELARAGRRPPELARAALGLGGSGGFEVGLFDQVQVDLLEEALVALGDEPSALRAEVTARLSVALSLVAPVARRLELAERAVADARVGADRAVLAKALAAHCDAVAGPADRRRRLAAAGEVVELATGLGDARLELLGRRLRLVAHLEQGRLADAGREIDDYARTATLLRQPAFEWYVPLWRGMRAMLDGRLEEADELAVEAAAVGARAGSLNAPILTLVLGWLLRIEGGRPAEAWELLTRDVAAQRELLPPWARIAVAFSAAHAGAADEARALLESVGLEGLAGAPVDSEWLPFLAQAAEVVYLVGGHPLGRSIYDRLLAFREAWVVEGIAAVCRGSVERPLGLLAAADGRAGEARAHFDAALAAHRGAGAPLLVARTLRDGGLALDDAAWSAAAAAAYREMGVEGPPGPDGPEPAVAGAEAGTGTRGGAGPGTGGGPAFRRDGDRWVVTFAGRTVHLRHVKGLADLAVLLGRPGREVAALDLVGAPDRPAAGTDLGEVIDERARSAYRARLVELAAELDRADAAGDAARSEAASSERDALLRQLAGGVGMGGRLRRAGGAAERARSAATWRLRDAIARVEAVHPALADHLRRSVRTGTYCCYDPAEALPWVLTPLAPPSP